MYIHIWRMTKSVLFISLKSLEESNWGDKFFFSLQAPKVTTVGLFKLENRIPFILLSWCPNDWLSQTLAHKSKSM